MVLVPSAIMEKGILFEPGRPCSSVVLTVGAGIAS